MKRAVLIIETSIRSSRTLSSYVHSVFTPGALPIIAAANILGVAALGASLMPAIRAAHVDALQALRSEELGKFGDRLGIVMAEVRRLSG